MELPGNFRHELKYQIGAAEHIALRSRLGCVMGRDGHARGDGLYLVRSIYFDNSDDKALREKINGVQKREKFRIRYYNDDLSFITLEKKLKYNDLCCKLDATLSEGECRALLARGTRGGCRSTRGARPRAVLQDALQRLRPLACSVSYVREPYVYAPGNVRVTFDSQIRTSLYGRGFLPGGISDVAASDSPAHVVLEVKYDAFLPEIISCLLQTEGLRRGAFSKYGACRRFG